MHVEIKTYPCTVGLHACNNYYIYRYSYSFLCGAVRFNLSAWRSSPRALTPAPALHHTQSGPSPFLTLPARRNAVLTIRATYCIWLFLDLFLRLLHLHRIVCQSVPATPSLYYHSTNTFLRSCGQALSFYPYSIRTDLFYTTFQNFTNSLQIRHKFVTSDLQSHVQKRIQPAICTNVVLFIQYERMHDPPAYIDSGRNSIQYTAK